MKILLDTCVWGGVCDYLRDKGFEVEWTGEWRSDPGDSEILDYAYKNDYIQVTLDKDFGELAVLRNQPHHGILRLVNIVSSEQGPICQQVLEKHAKFLFEGAIITASNKRLRIRSAD